MTYAIISTEEEKDFICKNEFEPPYTEIKTKLREKIWQLYCCGYNKFWLNCEYGIPLWSAEIIIALKMYNDITLNVAMPYEEQSTNWSEDIRNRFFHIHEYADRVCIVSNHYTPICYECTDKFMIENSDILLLVGKPDFNKLEKHYHEYKIEKLFL